MALPSLRALAVAALACVACGEAGATPHSTPAPPPAPLIVQVENSDASRPQSGLGGASIVYEYVAEGGVSRFSAIYAHAPATRVGPIRSVRLATLALLRQYQGVLVYSGASQYINGLLGSSGLPHFDESTARGDLFRIGGRAAPHNLYSDGAHLGDLLAHAAAQPIGYAYFQKRPLPSQGQGPRVATFTVPVSTSEAPTWAWDAARGGWTRSEPDTGPLLDAVDGRPLLATTVIVQQVSITEASQVVDANGVHGVAHQLSGSGPAQVFVDGREFDATWSQPTTGPPRLVLQNKASAPVVPGSVWIELVATAHPATIS